MYRADGDPVLFSPTLVHYFKCDAVTPWCLSSFSRSLCYYFLPSPPPSCSIHLSQHAEEHSRRIDHLQNIHSKTHITQSWSEWHLLKLAGEVWACFTKIASEKTHSECLASIASSSELSIVDPGAGKNKLSKKEKPTGGVKLKKSIAKKTKPKDIEGNSESRPHQSSLIQSSTSLRLYSFRHKGRSHYYSESFSRFSRCKWPRAKGGRRSRPYEMQLLQEALARVGRRFSCSIM